MRNFIGGLGAVLLWITGFVFYVGGILMMSEAWGLVGTLIGIFVFPVAFILSILSIFTSWAGFIFWVIWFGLIALMINYGDSNE